MPENKHTRPERRRTGLVLRPIDTLFFRDGHSFDSGAHVTTGLPLPQTLAGAVRTLLLTRLGCDFARLREAIVAGATLAEALAGPGQPQGVAAVAEVSVRGPWLARCDNDSVIPFVPTPATLLREKGGGRGDAISLTRADPLSPRSTLPGWNGDGPCDRPLWPRDVVQAKPAGGYLDLDGLRTFLQGGVPPPKSIREADDLFLLDRRTGIAIDPKTLAAAESFIYSATHLVLRQGVCFYAEVDSSAECLDLLGSSGLSMAFGGEARRVTVEPAAPVAWPRIRSEDSAGTVYLLTTPAPFTDPAAPPDLDIVSAAVPGHVAFSGWDLARGGPKPCRFAAAAGSVYFVEKQPAPDVESLCRGEDAVLGWGTCVQGVFEHV